jgi:peptidoglycan/xylan/chitin deacetylase (PgdA/CDA1 family)
MSDSLSADRLGAELAELKAAAAHNGGRLCRLDGLRWPRGARIAVNITVDFDAMLLRRLNNEPPMELAKGEFGGRVGIWRLLELFEAHAIKATIFTPGRICELYPEALRAAVAGGHELADHMWEHRVPKEPSLARDHLLKTAAALKAISGRRPVGSRSHYPAALLREEGFIYNSHGAPSHRPYYVLDECGRPLVLELPFHFAIDDAMFFSFAWYRSGNAGQRLADTDRVFDLWLAAFQQQYRQAGYLNICLHPFVSGRALRIAMLDRLIVAMKALPGVWFASCEEVARHCLAAHPVGAPAAAATSPSGA